MIVDRIKSIQDSTIEVTKKGGEVANYWVNARGVVSEEDNFRLTEQLQYKGNLLFIPIRRKLILEDLLDWIWHKMKNQLGSH